MSNQSLPAKISRPRLFDVVPRERLFALLDANQGRPLVWITSPPGAGKTTLVASYLETRNVPAIWYQVDAGDDDPAAVFQHLARAARALCASGDLPLPWFATEHLADTAGFARLFFRSLFAQLPAGTVLVLDNHQDAPADAPLHAILTECIAQTPPGHSTLVVSRVEAPAAFVPFAANGRMVTLGWDRLRLTQDEVVAICARRDVTDDWVVEALHRQSQGWAAGITLMLERVAHADGDARALPPETRESVFDYFANLLFDRASEATRRILLSIAFLPRITASMAVALSDHPAAPAMLEDLFRRHLFTDRRPGPEPVYEFHALFRDFLRMRARATLGTDALEHLVTRTADALDVARDVDSAMDLRLGHGQFHAACRVILAEAGSQLRDGRRRTLLRWIDALPDAVRDTEPWIVYWQGRARLQTEPEAGTRILERALQLFRERDDAAGSLDCLATLVGGAFLGFHALEAMDRWIDEFLDEIEQAPGTMPAEFELRVRGVLCMALFHTRPWSGATEPAYRRVEELLPRCADETVALAAAMGALVVSGLSGDFERGDRIAALAIGLASRDTASPSEAAWCFAQVGWLRFMEARYEEAIESLDAGAAIARANGLATVLRSTLLWRFTVIWRMHQHAAAQATLTAADAMPRSNQPMCEAQFLLFKARLAGDHGQVEESVRLALLAREWSLRTGSRLQEVIFGLSGSDILLRAHRPDAAAPLLAHVRTIIDRTPIYRCYRAVIRLMEARLAEVQGQRERALATLSLALAEAHEDHARYYLRFADWSMAPLFCLALERGMDVELVRDVIRLLRLVPPPDAPDNWPWPVHIVTLGRFDVQVNGASLAFHRKLPRKTLLLLKAIIASGGRDVPDVALCEALWGDDDGDAAANALSITLVRLRKLLGTTDAVQLRAGRISLNRAMVSVDADVFERRAAGNAPAGALDLYTGTFLPDDEHEPWSVRMRERLRGRFIDLLSGCGAVLEARGDPASAIPHYLRGIEADPVVEAFHLGLMRCYERLGRRTEALGAFRRMRQTLSVGLCIPPSEASQQFYRRLLDAQSADGGVPADSATVVWFEPRTPSASQRGR